MKPAGAGWEDFGGIEIADENVVEFGDSVAALSGDFEQADVGQRTVVELCRSLTRVVEIFELVEVGFGDGGFEAHADGASDGRTESSEDHVASGDGLDGGADVRPRLLVGVGVVHLRHLFRGFKTAGESPIYELHGGDPFVVWRDV